MKKIWLPVLAILWILSLTACSEKFDVDAPYKNVTVVYGILNTKDTAHYIRIQKAFLDPNKNALTMATVADSLYYAQLTVVMKEFYNGVMTDSTPLTKVDLTNEGYPKDTGTFANSPSYAYKYKHALSSLKTYRIVITNPISGEVDSSETSIITGDSTVFNVPYFNKDYHNNPNFSFSVIYPVTQNMFVVTFPVPPSAKLFEGIWRFHWIDSNTVTLTSTPHYADFIFGNDVYNGSNGYMSFTFPNQDFYYFLYSAMGVPSSPQIQRYLTGCNLFLYAGSYDFYNYEVITLTQSGGLTGDEIKPNWTNVKASTKEQNVIGLFTTRSYWKSPYPIYVDNATLNALDTNSITQALQIKGQIINP
jgi:hypothetical protein